MPGIPWWKTTSQKYLTAIENQVLKILRGLSQGEFFKTLLISGAIFFLGSRIHIFPCSEWHFH